MTRGRPKSAVTLRVAELLNEQPLTLRQIAQEAQLSYYHTERVVYNMRSRGEVVAVGYTPTQGRRASLFSVRRADPAPGDLTALLRFTFGR